MIRDVPAVTQLPRFRVDESQKRDRSRFAQPRLVTAGHARKSEASGRLRGIGATGEIVSAGIVSATTESGEPLDPGTFGMYFGDTEGPNSQPPRFVATGDGNPGAQLATGGGPFTSPGAYASGTGYGLLNLPSPFGNVSNTLAKTLSTLVWIALAVGVIWVVKENR